VKILLFGRDGQVGKELRRTLPPLGDVVACGRVEADFSEPERIRAIVRDVRPDVVVNAAAYTAVDKAESEPVLAHTINAASVGAIAQECARIGAWLVHYSTDYVYDGSKRTPYVETDATNPLSVYGRTKLAGEDAIRASGAEHLIFRTCWVYAVHGVNFISKILQRAAERRTLEVFDDQHGAPTDAALIADVTAIALRASAGDASGAVGLAGTYHLAPTGDTTWYDYACEIVAIARAAGLPVMVDTDGVRRSRTVVSPGQAVRPAYSVLSTALLTKKFGCEMPHWRSGLDRVVLDIGGRARA
jgi:dTDP-4-dehydrorhamnose reductase